MKSNKKTGKNRLDKYYHLAKEHGYRSRSAFKIIQLSKKFNIFQNCNVLVDLCAAPGGWLQVASKQLPVSSTIIGVDLVPIKPIKGVVTFQSDIRTPKCRSLIMSQLKGSEVDVVLHDGSPNMGCNWNLDAFNQNTLVLSAAKLACSILRKGGIFVTKVFRSSDYNSLVWMLGNCFDKIKVTKPQSSRNVSAEIFAICIGFKSLKGLDPRLFNVEYVFHTDRENKKVTDDKQNKSLNQLFKELKKTNREGYEEGSIYSEISVLDFLRSDTPASLLVNNNKLLFDIPKKSKDTKDAKNLKNTKDSKDTTNTENTKTNKEETKDTTDIKDLDSTESYEQDKELIQLVESDPLTTEEVKLLCSDLKVGGKSDLQSLLKWRFKLLKAYPSLDRKNNKKEKENKEKEQNEEETKENIELELDEEDKKIKDMIQHEKRKNERKQRKMMKKIKKGSTTESCSYLGPDPELFNLELLKRIEKEDEEEDDSEEEEEEGDNEKEAKDNRELDEDEEDNETETESDEDNEYYDDMDDELEFEDDDETDESDTEDVEDDEDEQEDNIQDPDFRRLMKMDVDLEVRHNIDKINESERPKNKKLTKREKSNLDKSTEMKQFLERMQYEAKMEAEREEEDKEEEEDEDEENETEESESEDEQDGSDEELEFEDEELKDINEEQEEYNEEEGDIISSRWFDQEIFDPNVEKESIKEKGKKKKRDRKNKKEDEDKDKEGFQVVPAISNSEIKELVKNEDFSDLSNDQDAVAHVQALGSLLINKKTRMELIDGAYNKRTFMDENLPSWFVDDENKHNKREYPVSKELMKKYKAKLIELKKRPIKKVLEAQHRKAMRAKKRFKSILPKIEAISSDVNSTGNANKLLRGLKKIKSTKRDKVYVISRKTGSKKISKTHNVGSRKVYKPVDRRMKKDNRRSKVKHKKKSRKARIH